MNSYQPIYATLEPEMMAAMVRDSRMYTPEHRPCPDKPLDEMSITELRVVASYLRSAHGDAIDAGMPEAVLDILEGWYYEPLKILGKHDGIFQQAVATVPCHAMPCPRPSKEI